MRAQPGENPTTILHWLRRDELTNPTRELLLRQLRNSKVYTFEWEVDRSLSNKDLDPTKNVSMEPGPAQYSDCVVGQRPSR